MYLHAPDEESLIWELHSTVLRGPYLCYARDRIGVGSMQGKRPNPQYYLSAYIKICLFIFVLGIHLGDAIY